MTRILLCAVLISACAGAGAESSDPAGPTAPQTKPQTETKTKTRAKAMHENPANDWLLDPASTRELWRRYHKAGDDVIARAKQALADARPHIRRAAIVVLTAAAAEAASPSYIATLDDPDALVASEAAMALSLYAPASLSGPADPAAMAALRAHLGAMRAWLAVPDAAVRYNTVRALIAAGDTAAPLAPLLGDETAFVRSSGLDLAAARTLSAEDVAALDALARYDPERDLRVRAVNIVAARAPRALAEPVLAAALDRGDADVSTADSILHEKWSSLVPNVVGFLRAHDRGVGAFYAALAELNAVCAASLMADVEHGLDGAGALEALGKLSGHPEWGPEKLREWGRAQPADVAPCRR